MTRTRRLPALGAYLSLALLAAWAAPSSRADDPKGPSTAGRKPGEVALRPATVTPMGTADPVEYEEGILFVPENRAEPNSRLIRVGFARFKATRPTTAPPVFYLPGGPGESYLTDVSRSFRGFDPYRAVADVVVVDQRGFSPRGDTITYTHKFAGDPLDRPSDMARDTADFVALARGAVADAARNGVDLRGYTAPECADDVDDLRKALGHDKITLCGTSFGSQWSFTTMRRHPGIVARALLSGVEPLDCGYDMPSHVFAAVQRMWWEAEKDPALRPYIPPGGLTAAAREILKRLDREPARVVVRDEKAGQDVTVALGASDFRRDFLRLAEPASLIAVHQGRYADWAKPIPNRRRAKEYTFNLLGPLIDTGLGVTPRRGFLLRTDPGSEFLGHWNFDDYLATAEIWPTADVGDAFRAEVVCDIPIVFAQGDWDTSTPVENLLTVVPYFPNNRVLIAEHGRHGVLGPINRANPPVMAKLLEFVRTGDLSVVPPFVSLPVTKFRVPDFAPAAGGPPSGD